MDKTYSLFDFMQAMSKAIIEAETTLTELDSAIGDGDCGQGMKSG